MNNLYAKVFKIFLDYIFALLLLIILSPILLIITLLILIIDGRPILYKQERIGQSRKKFVIYKFRTMKNSNGPLLTFDNDPRVTRLGSILRKYKFDELAQLINILKGEMSFVGPRPEAAIIAQKHFKVDSLIYTVKPGITGLSSINFFDEYKLIPNGKNNIYKTYFNKILPQKVSLDLRYIREISFLKDLTIALKTIVIIFRTILNI